MILCFWFFCLTKKEDKVSKTREKLDHFTTGFRGVRKGLPDTMKSWSEWHHKAMASGAVDVKTKEMIALGMALVLRCPGCIVLHVQACKKLGVTREEILGVFEVAMVMGGGPTMTYCAELHDALEEFYTQELPKEGKA